MKSSSRIPRVSTLAVGALLAAIIATPAQALNILFIANTSNDVAFQDYVSSQFAGVSWTHKVSGTGADQIGGDLDASRSFDGNTVTVRGYVNSFDLVIIGQPNTSTQFQQGADWADITTPILVANALIARGTGSRLGLTNGDFVQNPLVFGAADETVRTSVSALSDRVFARTTSQTNLYLNTQTDTISSGATDFGTGEIIARFGAGTVGMTAVNNSYAIGYWTAGSTGGGGFTFAADRAYIPTKAGFANDFTADGQIVVANLISELTGVSVIPEPSAAAALLGLGALGFVASRRRQRA